MTSNPRRVVRTQPPPSLMRENAWVRAPRSGDRAPSLDNSRARAGPAFLGCKTPPWQRVDPLFGPSESEEPPTVPQEGEWLECLQQFRAEIARQEAYARSAGRGFTSEEARYAPEAEARQQQDPAEVAQPEEDFVQGQSDYTQNYVLHPLQTRRPQLAPREPDGDSLTHRFQLSWLATHAHSNLPLDVLEGWLTDAEEAPDTRAAAELAAAELEAARRGPPRYGTSYGWTEVPLGTEVDLKDEDFFYLPSSPSIGELGRRLHEVFELPQSETLSTASDHGQDNTHGNSGGAAQNANGQEDAQPASTNRQKLPENDHQRLPQNDHQRLPQNDHQRLPQNDHQRLPQNDRQKLPENNRGNLIWKSKDFTPQSRLPDSSSDSDGQWRSWGYH